MAQVRVRGLNRSVFSRFGYGANAKKVGNNTVLLDLDDGNVRRTLQGQRGRFVVVPEMPITLQRAGAAATANPTATGLVHVFDRAATIERVIASVGTAPVGAALIIDVHKIASGGAATDAGTTIFTTQSRRPTIADGATVSSVTSATSGVPEVTTVAAGDILRVEIDQVGSGTAGSNLVVQIVAY